MGAQVRMDTLSKTSFVVGLLVVALGVAGCGSSGGDTSGDSSTTTVTKVVFIKQGDQICKDNYSKRTKLLTVLGTKYFKDKKPPPQAVQEEILVDKIMPVFHEESEELNDLPLPAEGGKEAEAILTGLEDAIAAVEANPAKSLKLGSEVEFSDVEKLAHEYGFEWCGRS
jgi:hypothetical protein